MCDVEDDGARAWHEAEKRAQWERDFLARVAAERVRLDQPRGAVKRQQLGSSDRRGTIELLEGSGGRQVIDNSTCGSPGSSTVGVSEMAGKSRYW